eukprot:SAG31_NODE_892_length_11180_cov_22.596426_6_plen_102_part_00
MPLVLPFPLLCLNGTRPCGADFSAHWCPPCRGFTPVLGKMFTETLAPKGMKIVFASSDRDESAFDEYYGEMPWMGEDCCYFLDFMGLSLLNLPCTHRETRG